MVVFSYQALLIFKLGLMTKLTISAPPGVMGQELPLVWVFWEA